MFDKYGIMMKTKNHKKKPVFLIFPGICICLFATGLWNLITVFLSYQESDEEYIELRRQYAVSDFPAPDTDDMAPSLEDSADAPLPVRRIDLAALKEINPETAGWIEIPDTIISYPFVHTNNNDYYLSHTFSNQENSAGSIFMEAANSPDFNDFHTILYGHNMKNGSMFAALRDYSGPDFYENHPYIYIDLENGTHCYEIFSCHEADTADICFSTGYVADGAYASFLNSLKSSSLYDTGVEPDGTVPSLTLATCTKQGSKRFVVHAKKIY